MVLQCCIIITLSKTQHRVIHKTVNITKSYKNERIRYDWMRFAINLFKWRGINFVTIKYLVEIFLNRARCTNLNQIIMWITMLNCVKVRIFKQYTSPNSECVRHLKKLHFADGGYRYLWMEYVLHLNISWRKAPVSETNVKRDRLYSIR